MGMSFKSKISNKEFWKDPIVILSICVILVSGTVIGTVYGSPTSLSGYQSVTAEWHQIVWPNAQLGTTTWTKSLDSNIVTWDPDLSGSEGSPSVPDGMSDFNTYYTEADQPRFKENIDYNGWWINDTVSEFAGPMQIPSMETVGTENIEDTDDFILKSINYIQIMNQKNYDINGKKNNNFGFFPFFFYNMYNQINIDKLR